MIEHFPDKIKETIKNMELNKIDIGRSSASVYQCVSDTKCYYLKIDSKDSALKNEYQNISWLNKTAPVPDIIEWDSDERSDYLLLSKINGVMLCDEYYLNRPETAVDVLAKALLLLHSIDIENCKISNNLENKLNMVNNNIQNNKVDINDWNEETHKLFKSPESLFDYLCKNKPKIEKPVFTHGDFCLPNIFGNKNEVTGFIDLGHAGISDKWQDIALCIRSFRYNFKTNEYDDLLLEKLGIKMDIDKFNYFILLDELF